MVENDDNSQDDTWNDDSRNDDSSSEMMKTVRLNLALYKTTAETLTVEMMTLRKNS